MPYQNGINPIIAIGSTIDDLHDLDPSFPVPSTYNWTLADISESDAGRDTTGFMYKERIGWAVSIQLEWKYLTTAEAAMVLAAFENEYFYMRYNDPRGRVGSNPGVHRVDEFYRGDISANMYSTAQNIKAPNVDGLWSEISFKVVSRGQR